MYEGFRSHLYKNGIACLLPDWPFLVILIFMEFSKRKSSFLPWVVEQELKIPWPGIWHFLSREQVLTQWVTKHLQLQISGTIEYFSHSTYSLQSSLKIVTSLFRILKSWRIQKSKFRNCKLTFTVNFKLLALLQRRHMLSLVSATLRVTKRHGEMYHVSCRSAPCTNWRVADRGFSNARMWLG